MAAEEFAVLADTLPGQFARWDSGYYHQIAESGYRHDGAERAFFPLYPLLARLLSVVIGFSTLWGGWIVSALAFPAAAAMLHRLVSLENGAATASRAVLWFCCSPMAFFFVAFYPEALFLLLSIAALYLARRGQFVLSGAVIALAGATRPTAFLLAVPYVVEFLLQRDFRRGRWYRWVGGAVLAPLGTGAYLLYLGYLDGGTRPLGAYGANLEHHWDSETTWPWVTFADAIEAAFFGVNIGSDWFSRVVVWQDLLAMLIGCALAVGACFWLRPSYSLLFVCSMIFYSTHHGPGGYVFESMPRHVASIVPLYPMLALAHGRLPQHLRFVPIVLSLALLGLLAAWFASGRWVS